LGAGAGALFTTFLAAAVMSDSGVKTSPFSMARD